MSGAVRSLVLGSSTACLFLLGLARAGAAQGILASARVSSVVRDAHPDSGKAALALEIAGLPSYPGWAIDREQVKLVDDAGRIYTPFAEAIEREAGRELLLAAQSLQPPQRSAKVRYLYWVAPASTRFELRLPSLQPVPITASVMK